MSGWRIPLLKPVSNVTQPECISCPHDPYFKLEWSPSAVSTPVAQQQLYRYRWRVDHERHLEPSFQKGNHKVQSLTLSNVSEHRMTRVYQQLRILCLVISCSRQNSNSEDFVTLKIPLDFRAWACLETGSRVICTQSLMKREEWVREQNLIRYTWWYFSNKMCYKTCC